jgi:glycerophosphoryl diester phosphodiesterase
MTIIAHRGASGYLPEHTLESASMAHAFNPDFIEPDLVMTKDDVLVVLHDIHIDTTTNVAKVFPRNKRKDGRYYAIDFTLKQLKSLKVMERGNVKSGKAIYEDRFPRGRANFEVPTFREFIELVEGLNKSRKMNIGIYPEMKSPSFHRQNKKDILKETWKVLNDYGYTSGKKKIFLQCFDSSALKEFKKRFNPKFPLIQLIGDNSWKESPDDYTKMLTPKGLKEVSIYAQGIGPWFPQLIQPVGRSYRITPLAKVAKSLGLKIHTYTLREDSLPEYVDSVKGLSVILAREGVDGVFTDFPDRIRE